MYYYAQLVGGVCHAVTQTYRAMQGADFVPIDSLDTSYIGRTYAGGVWV